MPAPRDITGMRFDSLVAIEKVKSRNGNTYWKFRCDCGNEKEIQTGNVTSGRVKSCGCLLNAIRDMSKDMCPNDANPRICRICENEFYGFVGDTRVFCYECSPRGATVAEAKRTQNRAIKHLLVEYKGGQCVDCGYYKCEGALQFHHSDGGDKDFILSSSANPSARTMEELYAEADKCVLLCANCHAKKHEVVDKVAAIMHLPTTNDKNYGVKYCVVCNSEFIANRPHRNYCYTCSPEGFNAKDAARIKKRAIKRELLTYKGGAVCSSCGYDEYEGALQLHHRNPAEKEFTFSRTALNNADFTMGRLKREADKCDVLCANCHAEVHYKNGDDDLELE